MADATKNFAFSLVATAPSPATSGTSLVVTTGDGTLFPAAPFDLTMWPAGAQPTAANAEIARVTAVSTDTFTITRAQYGTTAQSVATGWNVAQNITAAMLSQLLALSGGTMTGPIAMGANKITGLANGSASTDAAAFGQIPTSASSIGGMATTTYDPAAIAQQVAGTTATQTLTNKRVTKRVLALSANSATPAVNTDNYDVVHITGQTATITGFIMTGTPVDGDTLRISITGTAAVPFTLGSSFESSTVALPTTTSGTARLDVGFFWNTETSKWRCVAVA